MPRPETFGMALVCISWRPCAMDEGSPNKYSNRMTKIWQKWWILSDHPVFQQQTNEIRH